MRKILAAALLAATPACAGTISLTCARPTGSYKVQVASTGAVTLLPAYGAPATFAGGGAPTGRTRIRNTLNTVERVPILPNLQYRNQIDRVIGRPTD
jgi:hypothetical protein